MSYRVKVATFSRAYRHAGIFIKKKYGSDDLIEILEKMESEFNLKSFTVETNDSLIRDHYFEFPQEKDFTMFILKWAS
jgi:predicted Zn-dependent protease